MTQDINCAIIAQNFKVAVVRCEPSVEDFADFDFGAAQIKTARGLFTPVARVAFDPDIHAY